MEVSNKELVKPIFRRNEIVEYKGEGWPQSSPKAQVPRKGLRGTIKDASRALDDGIEYHIQFEFVKDHALQGTIKGFTINQDLLEGIKLKFKDGDIVQMVDDKAELRRSYKVIAAKITTRRNHYLLYCLETKKPIYNLFSEAELELISITPESTDLNHVDYTTVEGDKG